MKELENYVDNLFKNYIGAKESREIKEEILSNLEARVSDYMENGISREEAVSLATKNIQNVDFIIDGNVRIYSDKYKLELMQSALISILVSWIITIPLRMVQSGMMVNNIFTIVLIISGLIYVLKYAKKERESLNAINIVNIRRILRLRNIIWVCWILYIITATLYTTALRFGSNIWFHRRIRFDGPYQFAIVIISYITPIITIIVPLIADKAFSLLGKYEVKD